MPQQSYAYAVARTRALEARMIDSAKFSRLKEADLKEALKILQEAGYGAGAQGDEEDLIRAELENARDYVDKVTPDLELTRLFLLETDAHNLKALLKARILGDISQADALLEQGGAFDAEVLTQCVKEGDYRALPEAFRGALAAVEKLLSNKNDPRALSAAVDKAVFDYIGQALSGKKSDFGKTYFSARADFLNVRSAIRARALRWTAEELSPMLVSGGEITVRDLLESLETPNDQLSKKLGKGKNARAIAISLDEYAQSGSVQTLEKQMDEALMRLVRAGKSDTFGIGPVIGYLLGREAEARALRLVFASKRTGRDVELPALYIQ